MIGKPSRQTVHLVAEVHVPHPVGQREQPPTAADRKLPTGQTQAPLIVAGKLSGQVRQKFALLQVRQEAEHFVQPFGTASRKYPVVHRQEFVAVIGNPSRQVKQLVSLMMQVLHGELQSDEHP